MAVAHIDLRKILERKWGPPEESRDGCVYKVLSLQLQKPPAPNFEEKCGNSPDISKGISQSGMCKFESSQVSQSVSQLKIVQSQIREMPANCGLLQSHRHKAETALDLERTLALSRQQPGML
jgi:hypothetical protein